MRKNIIPAFSLLLACFLTSLNLSAKDTKTPIRIGIMHSATDTMAVSGQALFDATKMAVNEINSSGGLLGHQVEMVIEDNRSERGLFTVQSERLIEQGKVSAIFGCWTSACRKAVVPVVERLDNLLFNSIQHEGLESSSNVVYTSAAPNQQIIPGVKWALSNLGRQFYLIGSDNIFPRTANLIIKDMVRAHQGAILNERYLPLDSNDVAEIISEIQQLQPEAILNTLNGESNHHFFNALHQAGLDSIPVLSFSLSEPELSGIASARRDNHYTVWSYFQSIDNLENQKFVTEFKHRYGQQHVINDQMETTYVSIKLWAQAVREANSPDPVKVNKSINHQSLKAPEGIVSFDAETRHLWKMVRIGQAQADGQFKIVWQINRPIRPTPFPEYRAKFQGHKLQEEISATEAKN